MSSSGVRGRGDVFIGSVIGSSDMLCWITTPPARGGRSPAPAMWPDSRRTPIDDQHGGTDAKANDGDPRGGDPLRSAIDAGLSFPWSIHPLFSPRQRHFALPGGAVYGFAERGRRRQGDELDKCFTVRFMYGADVELVGVHLNKPGVARGVPDQLSGTAPRTAQPQMNRRIRGVGAPESSLGRLLLSKMQSQHGSAVQGQGRHGANRDGSQVHDIGPGRLRMSEIRSSTSGARAPDGPQRGRLASVRSRSSQRSNETASGASARTSSTAA